MRRAVFIGGPMNGTTKTLDGEPPKEWIAPGELIFSLASLDEESGIPMQVLPCHRYRMVCRTPFTETFVYDHEGQIR